jgi:hypothetical protein
VSSIRDFGRGGEAVLLTCEVKVCFSNVCSANTGLTWPELEAKLHVYHAPRSKAAES